MAEDTFHAKIASVLDVLDELERETRYYLQNPEAPVHGVPGEPAAKVPSAPVKEGLDLKFAMGMESLSNHTQRPYIVWTLGDVDLKKPERKVPTPRIPGAPERKERQAPLAFKKMGEGITAWCFGALDPKESDPRRQSVRGTERLKAALLWCIHHHWHGICQMGRLRWEEVPGASRYGYAFVIPFTIELSLMRPRQLLAPVTGVEASHELEHPEPGNYP